MADYPSYGQLLSSGTDGDGAAIVDRAQDGSARARSFYPSTKRTFTVRHILTAAEVATLLTFYETNKLLAVDLAWTGPDAGDYTCLFTARPTFRALAPDAFEAESRLIEQ